MANENGVESFTCLLVSCDPVLQIKSFFLFLFYEETLEDIACSHDGEWCPLAAARPGTTHFTHVNAGLLAAR